MPEGIPPRRLFFGLGLSQPTGGTAIDIHHLDQTVRQLPGPKAKLAPRENPRGQTDAAETFLTQLDPKRTHILEHGHKRVSSLARSVNSYVDQNRERDDLAAQSCLWMDADRERIMNLPLGHIGNEQFARLLSGKNEAEILGPLPEDDLPTRKARLPNDVPTYLASLYEVPLLTRAQEVHLFRKMNYLKYKASTLRAHAEVSLPESSWLNQIEKLYEESVATKNQIITANLRVVVSIAKGYAGPAGDFFELVSDGNVSLIKAVEKFDFSRGNRFRAYATWAIVKNFARTVPNALRHQGRFRSNCPELFSAIEDTRSAHCEQESAQIQRASHVERLLERLDSREQQIVTSRFGLFRSREPLNLRQIGDAMGLTKERIRQIQCRAMSKLQQAAREDRLEDTL